MKSKFLYKKVAQEIEDLLRNGNLRNIGLSYVSFDNDRITLSNYHWEDISEEDYQIMHDFFDKRNMKFKRHEHINRFDATYDEEDNMISNGGYSSTYYFYAYFKKEQNAPNSIPEFFKP